MKGYEGIERYERRARDEYESMKGFEDMKRCKGIKRYDMRQCSYNIT